MMRVMSTSLKVVSWAAAFWASLRRNAMVLRSRDIGTRSSRSAWARGPDGVATAWAGLAARDSRASSMSPLVTRPSRPLPATDAVGMPDSVPMRWAEGMAGASLFGADAGLGASAFGAGLGASLLAARLAAGSEEALPALPSAIEPNTVPTCTVAPALTEMDSIEPAAVSYTHLRAHETGRNLVCRLLLEKKKTQ